MRKLNRISYILIIYIISALVFTGCLPKKSVKNLEKYSNKKYRIGFAMPTFDDAFLGTLMNAAKKEAKKLKDTDIVFVDAKNDATRQKSQIANLIAQQCNAIIVCPVDTSQSASYTNMAKDAGIPIISVNRFLQNQDDATAYVGSESITAGIMQMEYLAKQLNGKGSIAILRGEDTQEAAIMRTKGVKQVLKKYPNIKITAETTGKWQRTLGKQITAGWIKDGIKFDAIAANNDEMAIGAIMALKDKNMLNKVIVGGVDATPDALKCMKAGELKITVFQNAAGQGAGAIKAAYKVAKGGSVDKKIYIPYELVTPDNMSNYEK